MIELPAGPLYTVCVYVAHGYFEYDLHEPDKAIEHAQQIMASGVYRHSYLGGVEFYPVVKVKVVGPGLDSAYPDRFVRT